MLFTLRLMGANAISHRFLRDVREMKALTQCQVFVGSNVMSCCFEMFFHGPQCFWDLDEVLMGI